MKFRSDSTITLHFKDDEERRLVAEESKRIARDLGNPSIFRLTKPALIIMPDSTDLMTVDDSKPGRLTIRIRSLVSGRENTLTRFRKILGL